MPNPSNIPAKIDRLAEIAIDECGIDAQTMHRSVERAKKINERAASAGFTSTDVFMAEDGTLAISAYSRNGSLGIAVLDNGYDYYVERNRKKVDFATNVSERQVFTILDIWGEVWGRLWRLSESYQDTHTTPTREGSTRLHSGEIVQAGFPLLRPIVWTPRELVSVSS